MDNEIHNFYQNVDLEQYEKKLFDLPPKLLVSEFQEVNAMTESGHIDQARVAYLIAAVERVLLIRLQVSDTYIRQGWKK